MGKVKVFVTDGQTDRQTDGRMRFNVPTLSLKAGDNKQGVKLRIGISLYALGVQSSAYLLFKIKTKVKLWIDDVHLSDRLSTYRQCDVYSALWLFDDTNMCLQYDTTRIKLANLYQFYLKRHQNADPTPFNSTSVPFSALW